MKKYDARSRLEPQGNQEWRSYEKSLFLSHSKPREIGSFSYTDDPLETIEIKKSQKCENNFILKKVHICFQGFTISDDYLFLLFSRLGRLRQAYVCRNTPTGQNTLGYNFGFVTFFNFEDANYLVSLGYVYLDGYRFRIKKVKYKEEYACKSRSKQKSKRPHQT